MIDESEKKPTRWQRAASIVGRVLLFGGPLFGSIAAIGTGVYMLFGIEWAVIVAGGLFWLDGYLPAR